MSGSPKRPNPQVNQFYTTCQNDTFGRKPIETMHAQSLKERVTRDLTGTNPVVPLNPEDIIKEVTKRTASPAKVARVEGYMHSNGMKASIRDAVVNDCTKGLVTVKPHTDTKAYIKPFKREVWKPKVSLQWYEPYRAPLTL
jgi:hypothetical protein